MNCNDFKLKISEDLHLLQSFDELNINEKKKLLKLFEKKFVDPDDGDVVTIEDTTLQATKSLFLEQSFNSNVCNDSIPITNYRKTVVIPVLTNNLGKATLLVNPRFLVSNSRIISFSNDISMNLSSAYLFNDYGKSFHEWNQTNIINNNFSSTINFDSYKLLKCKVIINPDSSQCFDGDNIEIPDFSRDNSITFSEVNGRIISTITDIYQVFNNKFFTIKANNDEALKYYQFDDVCKFEYNIVSDDSTITEYIKNGFTPSQMLPCVLTESLTKLPNIKLISFSHDFVSETSAIEFTDKHILNDLHFFKNLQSKGETMPDSYDQSDYKLENYFKIDFNSKPYSVFTVKIELEFALTNVDVNQLTTIFLKDLVLKKRVLPPLLSTNDNLVYQFMRNFRKYTANKSNDFIRNQIYNNESNGFWDGLLNFGKSVASTAGQIIQGGAALISKVKTVAGALSGL